MMTFKSFLEQNVNSFKDIDITEDIVFSLKDVSLLPVIPNPNKIFCVGLNYLAHIEEVGAQESDYPMIFQRVANSQIGHKNNLILPKESNDFDFEGEIAVIIGKDQL